MRCHPVQSILLLMLVSAVGCGGPKPLPTAGHNPFGAGQPGAAAPVVPPLAAKPLVGATPGANTPGTPAPGAAATAQPGGPGAAAPAVAAASPGVTPGRLEEMPPTISASPQPGTTAVVAAATPVAPPGAAVKPAAPLPSPEPAGTQETIGGDWPQFRGSDGTARAEDADPPVEWSETENLIFVAPLEGAGASSPIILGQDLYLTEYNAVGVDPKRANRPATVERFIVCLNAVTGEQRWRSEIGTDSKSPALTGFIARHGYTSSTPVTDGQRVFAYFGHVGLSAVEIDGTVIGTKPLGSKLTQMGTWASPILHGPNLIVNASQEGFGLVALDSDANEVWKRNRVNPSTATPVLVRTAEGNEELVFSGPEMILGLDPETGEELWHFDWNEETVGASPVVHDDVVYVAGGKAGTVLAIRAGGKGNVTYSTAHRLWKAADAPEYATPVWNDGRLFLVGQDGRVRVLVAETGQLAGQRVLPDAQVFAAPLVAAGRLYVVTREGGVYVLSADEKLDVLAQNRIAGDETPFNASPAVIGSRIYLRSNKAVYCFGPEN